MEAARRVRGARPVGRLHHTGCSSRSPARARGPFVVARATLPTAAPPVSPAPTRPTLIVFARIEWDTDRGFIGEVTTPEQLARMRLRSGREATVSAGVLPYQRPGVRVFVYEGLDGCSNEDATLRIAPPVMFPELPFVANCMVPQWYLVVFAVPTKLVPDPLDIGCAPGPITCPRRGPPR
ncbi:hypothetical protein [Phytohabitans houttuyneae]|uniref:Uncharacterized protein n=1 Tax=Phytohabitans houttuyneae TaxID=1076126 RepID=A0A6V8KBX1_9ACTN|nr:hypothetical protein [Phytohabitans houttuyneae]GFJ81254.1 hypothetical protein Phou_054340 [Phytohabitans houttuyneae]